MILQALNSYYERLEKDSNVDNIASFGYSRQHISFRVILESDGRLHGVEPLARKEGAKYVPALHIVPGDGSRSGKTPKPFLLWDNALYVFGVPPSDKSAKWAYERFAAFRELHLKNEAEIDDSGYSAVCRFLESWSPNDNRIDVASLGTYYGIFKLRNEKKNLHDRPRFVDWWRKRTEAAVAVSRTDIVQCLVTGEFAPVAGSHTPKIKGIADKPGKPSEKFLVAVDKDFKSAESYGKKQNGNSPVSVRTAFQYCTALNHLLAPDSRQRIQIGDASTVFWTEKPTKAENLLPWILEPSKDAEDEALKNALHSMLDRIQHGIYPDELGEKSTRFYILGLSPNAARISVRFWHVSTLGDVVENLHQHFKDLEIAGETEADRTSSIQQLLQETVPLRNGWPDRDKISPQLAGHVGHAVLAGQMYPGLLLDKLLYRIRADGFVDTDKHKGWRKARHRRAAILKAFVNRYFRLQRPQQKEHSVDTYLNKLHPHPAYQCGRLMGVLAFVQERALKKVNSSVVRRFLSAVSSAPALHLGRLQVQAEIGHLPKLDGDLPGYLRDEMKQINVQLRDSLPNSLNRIGQSLFVLGFYQELTHLERTSPNVDRKRNLHIRRTDAGEWVRSLGEQQVANCLFQLGINYYYEPRAVLVQGPNRYPDFFMPGASDERHNYIEYLGMNTPEYNAKWKEKLEAYRATGITEEGGDHGRLFVIDCREERWGDTKMLSQLQKWFQIETIETSSNTTEKE